MKPLMTTEKKSAAAALKKQKRRRTKKNKPPPQNKMEKASSNGALMDSKKFVRRYAKRLFLEDFEKGILCLAPWAAARLQIKHKGKRIKALGAYWDFYKKEKTAVISGFGFGAPAALLILEYLSALKPSAVFSLGAIASLNKEIKIGDRILIKSAGAQESELYKKALAKSLKTGKEAAGAGKIKKALLNKSLLQAPSYAAPWKKSSEKLIRAFDLKPAAALSAFRPYSIEKKDYAFCRSQNILGLEMESAALISRAQNLKIPLFCLAAASDLISEKGWQMGFSNKAFQKSLYGLLEGLLALRLNQIQDPAK